MKNLWEFAHIWWLGWLNCQAIEVPPRNISIYWIHVNIEVADQPKYIYLQVKKRRESTGPSFLKQVGSLGLTPSCSSWRWSLKQRKLLPHMYKPLTHREKGRILIVAGKARLQHLFKISLLHTEKELVYCPERGPWGYGSKLAQKANTCQTQKQLPQFRQ